MEHPVLLYSLRLNPNWIVEDQIIFTYTPETARVVFVLSLCTLSDRNIYVSCLQGGISCKQPRATGCGWFPSLGAAGYNLRSFYRPAPK